MEKNVAAESGLQLVGRLCQRPSLLHLDDILFPGGPEPGDIIQISGASSVGKSLLLLKFLTKTLLPKSYEGNEIGGLETGVILINTDHSISIFKLGSLMEQFIYNANSSDFSGEKTGILRSPELIEKIIIDSLKRLIVLKTYSSMQLEMNFFSLEKILSGNSNISLLIIDSLTSYYWSDITNHKNIRKMDLYLKVLIEKFKRYAEEFKLVSVFITQGCGYQKKFEELSAAIKSHCPNVEVEALNGRIGSFEVTVNDVLVYSKLQNLAFPDFESVVEVVKEVASGMPPREILKYEPRTFCVIA